MEPYFKEEGYTLTSTHLYQEQNFPTINDFDWLIVMGGPMGIYDNEIYPWLDAEKAFIKSAIESGKIVIGICLGAQLIADVMGKKVYKNIHREIGWFNITRSLEAEQNALAQAFPDHAKVFHWHGDTFDIPEGANLLAESEACKNQGFIFDNRLVAFQFHLETTPKSAALIENCRDELDGSTYVQSEEELLANPERFTVINKIMFSVLDRLTDLHSS